MQHPLQTHPAPLPFVLTPFILIVRFSWLCITQRHKEKSDGLVLCSERHSSIVTPGCCSSFVLFFSSSGGQAHTSLSGVMRTASAARHPSASDYRHGVWFPSISVASSDLDGRAAKTNSDIRWCAEMADAQCKETYEESVKSVWTKIISWREGMESWPFWSKFGNYKKSCSKYELRIAQSKLWLTICKTGWALVSKAASCSLV